MERTDIKEKLNAIFRKIFNDSSIEINETMTSDDVDNWDSLTHMLMISSTEKAFGIKFKLKEVGQLQNVGDIINLIEKKINQMAV